MYGVRVIFEAAAPLKHANEVVLYSSGGATIWSHFETFMSNFVALKSLDMRIKEDVFSSVQLEVPSPGIRTRSSTDHRGR